MHFLLPLFLLILLPSVPVFCVVVTTTSPRVFAREGTEAVLSCVFKTQQETKPRIEWKKKGQDVSFVYFGGDFQGRYVNRASIEGATVTLRGVTQEDAGVYRCEVSASRDPVSLGEANIMLTVLVPPQVPTCEIPSSAVTGSVVQLSCQDHHGIPAVTYTWYKDKTPISPTPRANHSYTMNPHTGVLTFQQVTKDDSGRYHCEVKNGVGTPKSCQGNHMKIDDLNVPAIIAGVVAVCLALSACILGACYAHRHGYFSRHPGGPSAGYSPPPQEPLDFKHTQSFML